MKLSDMRKIAEASGWKNMCRSNIQEKRVHLANREISEEQERCFHAHITLDPDGRVVGPAAPNQAPITGCIFSFRPVRVDAVQLVVICHRGVLVCPL